MKQLRYGERGQVLVMAALMMTALLGMLGLVIDVGNAYAQRRFMQNGADAAAVAAARYMATNRSTANDPGVMGTMTPLLTSNGSGALASPTTQSDGAWYVRLDGSVAGPAGGGGGLPSGAAGVRVNATKTVPTYFARVLGVNLLTVKATAEAIWGAAERVYLDSSRTGTLVMPLAFDVDAYRNSFTLCGGSFGTSFNYSLFVDIPTDCALGSHDVHFSYTTLNIGDNCSNSTMQGVLDSLLDNPGSLGSNYLEAGVTPIQVCHGVRDSTWDQIPLNRPFLVPLIGHPAAAGCSSTCTTPVVGFVYMEKRGQGGHGSGTYLIGEWVDPSTQPPLPASGVLTSGGVVPGPVSYTLSR